MPTISIIIRDLRLQKSKNDNSIEDGKNDKRDVIISQLTSNFTVYFKFFFFF